MPEITVNNSINEQEPRAVVIVKHVGMNVPDDPLITSATYTIGVGVVIIAGDDPGADGVSGSGYPIKAKSFVA